MSRVPTWLLTALSVLSTALLASTLLVPTWIEEFLHLDPDGGSGAAEAIITLGLIAVGLTTGIGAVLTWRSRRAAELAAAQGNAP